MATWIWIVIAIGAIVLSAVLALGGRKASERRVVKRRQEAQELRQEAEVRTRRAEEREALAQEQADRAEAERKEAAEVEARAARVDPDRDDE
jgi:ABC-type protease/lipase transport system fused ATPase/permease subunit